MRRRVYRVIGCADGVSSVRLDVQRTSGAWTEGFSNAVEAWLTIEQCDALLIAGWRRRGGSLWHPACYGPMADFGLPV